MKYSPNIVVFFRVWPGVQSLVSEEMGTVWQLREILFVFWLRVRYNMVYSGLYECNEYNAL